MQGDPTYLVTAADGASLEPYGINAVCTHLGCVVPWAAVGQLANGIAAHTYRTSYGVCVHL